MKGNPQNVKTPKGGLIVSDLPKSLASQRAPSPSKQHCQNRGQTTISPPAKVKLDVSSEARILVSGIDSLYLSMQVSWSNDGLFEYLEYMKKCAVDEEEDIPIIFKNKDNDEYGFSVKPHGTNGYEWLLIGKEYSLKIGNWLNPIQRPSIMAEVRSEVLWRMGLIDSVDHIVGMIENQNSMVDNIKLSRVDICLDFFYRRIFGLLI